MKKKLDSYCISFVALGVMRNERIKKKEKINE